MGEVGEALPEKTVEQPSCTTAVSTTTPDEVIAPTIADKSATSLQNGSNEATAAVAVQNGNSRENEEAEPMEVDDTEEESQISSSENGTLDSKIEDVDKDEAHPILKPTEEDSLASADVEERESELEEISQDSQEDDDKMATEESCGEAESQDGVIKEKDKENALEDDGITEDEEFSRSSAGLKNGSANGETEIEEESQDVTSEAPTSQGDENTRDTNGKDEEEEEESMEVSQIEDALSPEKGEEKDDDVQIAATEVVLVKESPEKTVEEEKAIEEKVQEKADKITVEKQSSDDVHIIESDNEDDEVEAIAAEKIDEKSDKKAPSIADSEDAAVVIGSDSEDEIDAKSESSRKRQRADEESDSDPLQLVSEKSQSTNDDDDCVVIEDDDVKDEEHTTPKNLVKIRDFAGIDADITEVPPAKKQKISTPNISINSNSSMGQITIKDARTLMPPSTFQQSFTQATKDKDTLGANSQIKTMTITPISGGSQNVYPVNLRTTQSSKQLVPNPASALPSLTNANLLPGLTDDMFVLEAPSFIVPYIYEKPPVDNLKDIVKKIETEFDLKNDEEKENEEVPEEIAAITKAPPAAPSSDKSKKKKGGEGDGDESWGESSPDDDDDSESETRTKVLIKTAEDDLSVLKAAVSKPTTAIAKTTGTAADKSDNYFDSPLGKFFMDIGIGLVQEHVQHDLLRIQKRKLRRLTKTSSEVTAIEGAVKALKGNLEASRKHNKPFKFEMKRCEFCPFKSESALVMAHHYATPHMNGVMYKCNFCSYEIRTSYILFHMEAEHNIKGRLEKGPSYHACPNCPYEDNGKAKLARHAVVCAKKFRPEKNLAPPQDWEAPAKIPRIKPRHGLVGTATAYQAMAAQAAAQKAALASIQLQQQQAQQQLRNMPLAVNSLTPKHQTPSRGRPQTVTKNTPNNGTVLRGGMNAGRQQQNNMSNNIILPNNYQISGGQLIQGQNLSAKKNSGQQPSISITPLPRQTPAQSSSQGQSGSNVQKPPAGMKPGQHPSGNKTSFVICEICDGYIKDLEQLRNHMTWMHKVKIHPKMIYNRPPLNCQKCQFRFFTDQGLERHLLGSHGLVTSSMQEAANKGKDAGRCPVCGRMYQWKLLNHVSRDHHMTLKPAHLSYKCTVCTATFGMYKQFENHVYTAHSTVAKKAMDGKKGSSQSSNNNSASSSGGSSNNSLLKPLKINDEITIIPQPSTKSRNSMSNIESHVID